MKFNEFAIGMDEMPNNNMLTEAGLSRLLARIKNKDFAIITAFRNEFDKKENIKRNRSLRGSFNSKKMGVYQLIGHWQECQDDTIDYNACPKDQLQDVIERSYLSIKPDDMDQEDFIKYITSLNKEYKQDGAVISLDGNINIVDKNGSLMKIGSKVSLNKISQAYSQFIKKQNVPFVFECEVPSSNSGRMVMNVENIKYPICERHERKGWPLFCS